MKKIIIAAILAFIVVSCQITERMYLQENGSVQTEYEIDFTGFLSSFLPEEDMDSLRNIGEFPIDTLIYFKDIGKANIMGEEDQPSEAELEYFETLDKTMIRIVIDESAGYFRSVTEAKDINELNAYNRKVELAYRELESKEKDAAQEVSAFYSPMVYEFDGKSFERKSLAEKVDLTNPTDSALIDLKSMMSFYSYSIEYHFPKKVKSATIDSIELSPDGKIMTREIDYGDLLENPEKYNFKVTFE